MPSTLCNGFPAVVKQSGFYSLYNDHQTDDDETPGWLYGMFEMRCKLPPGSTTHATYPSFWLVSNSQVTPEIDVYEHHAGSDYVFHGVHWPDATDPVDGKSECYQYWKLPYSLSEDFHTWTLVWTPEKITWFLDGVELWTDTDPTHMPGHEAIANPKNAFIQAKMYMLIGNGAENYNFSSNQTGSKSDPLIIDYVKVYKPETYNAYKNQYPFWNNDSNQRAYYNYLVTLYQNTPYKSTSDWVNTVIESTDPYYVAQPISGSSLAGLQGGGKFMHRGGLNTLWSTYWDGSAWQSYTNGNYCDGNIALAKDGDQIFYTESSNLYYAYNNVVTSVLPSNQVNTDVLPHPNGDKVYHTNFNNEILLSTEFAPSIWTTSVISPLPDVIPGTVIVDPNDYETLYYINTSKNIIKLNWNGSSWNVTPLTFYTSTSPGAAISSLAIDVNTNRIYYRSVNNTLYFTDIGSFYSQPFQAHLWGGATLSTVNNIDRDILISRDPGNFQIFYIGTDQYPYTIYPDNGSYEMNRLFNNLSKISNGTRMSLITFGQQDPLKTEILYCGIDGQIRVLEYAVNSCENLNPACDPEPKFKPTHPLKNNNNSDTSHTALGSTHNIVSTLLTESTDKEQSNQSHNEISNKIELYPNPANDKVYITYTKFAKRIVLSNTSGKQVADMALPEDKNVIEIDLTDKNPGLYILSVFTEMGKQTFKLSKY